MGRIIAIANQKGGVGKTTTSINLSASLAAKGKKVLVIDTDPQGNTTSGFGIEKNELENTIYELVLGECSIRDCIISNIIKNVSVVPSNVNLAAAEIELIGVDKKEYILKNEVDYVKDDYDFIIIDCMPSLGMLTINAMSAANSVLIPVQPQYYAADGLTELLKVVKGTKKRFNPEIEVEGILFTMDSARYNNSKRNKRAVKEAYGKEIRVFENSIPRSEAIAEIASEGISIFAYDSRSKGAKNYEMLAQEVLNRA